MGEVNFEQANNELNELLSRNNFKTMNEVAGFLAIALLDIYSRNVLASNFEFKRQEDETEVS